MAEARCHADWARTSALMALAVNLVRDPRRTPAAKPNDFNPYAPRPKKPILRGKQLEILRDVFVKNAPAPGDRGKEREPGSEEERPPSRAFLSSDTRRGPKAINSPDRPESLTISPK